MCYIGVFTGVESVMCKEKVVKTRSVQIRNATKVNTNLTREIFHWQC